MCCHVCGEIDCSCEIDPVIASFIWSLIQKHLKALRSNPPTSKLVPIKTEYIIEMSNSTDTRGWSTQFDVWRNDY